MTIDDVLPLASNGNSRRQNDENQEAEGRDTNVSRWLPYIAACFCTLVSSGGLILGNGPFSSRLISDGYLSDEQVSIVFTGSFQIMTWGSIVAVHIESRLGPRWSAAIGACIEFAGHLSLGFLSQPASPMVVLVSYGLIGWGGNHIFFSCFQFAQLFPEGVGIADGFLAGLFNTAGCMLLLLNIPAVAFGTMFKVMASVTCVSLFLILVLWPDRSYRSGDRAVISLPSLRYAKKLWSIKTYQKGWDQIVNGRYVQYALTFAYSCLITQYVMGNLVAFVNANTVNDAYMKWAYPLICNPTFLFTPAVGYIIDRTGFALISMILLGLCQVSLWSLANTHSTSAAWISLPTLNWMCSIQYTIEFVFLHKALREDAFSVGLVIVLIVQGLFGFVASPGLSPNPWGANYLPPIIGLSIIGFPLLSWPISEWRRQRDRYNEPQSPSVVGSHSVIFASRAD